MQALDFWHKFDICWGKISIIFLLIVSSFISRAQESKTINLINYGDEKIHYGFLFAAHSSKYVIDYSKNYSSVALDTLHSIVSSNLFGFKIGFIAAPKITEYVDLRASVTLGFYQRDLNYRFTDKSILTVFDEPVTIEFPILLKFKSVRNKNSNAYFLSGITPSFNLKEPFPTTKEKLEIKPVSVAIEVGMGLDIYAPYFKFSPEIRYSYGLTNLLSSEENSYNLALNRLVHQHFSFYITFEGSPSKGRRKKSKKLKFREHTKFP